MIAYFFTLRCVFSRLIKILDSTRARAALNDVRPPNILNTCTINRQNPADSVYMYMYMEEFDILCRQRIYHKLHLHLFIQFLHSYKCKQENNFLVFIPRY